MDNGMLRRSEELILEDKLIHANQTVDVVKEKKAYWCKFNHVRLPVMDVFDWLRDKSNPPRHSSLEVHGYLTAEGIRKEYPDLDWFHLTGLVHDMGRIMTEFGEEKWAAFGRAYPVGCAPSDKLLSTTGNFEANPDFVHEVYSKRLGMYKENCGLENVLMTWGHAEYLYHVLKNHADCTLPEKALYMIRYHAFHALFDDGDYTYLCNEEDLRRVDLLREFSKYDLHLKPGESMDIDALRPYYESLVQKYIPGVVCW